MEIIDSKFLDFRVQEKKKAAQTITIGIYSKRAGDFLGQIFWGREWRQYVFAPMSNTIFSAGCMDDIRKYIINLMQAREVAKIKLHPKPWPAGRYGG